MGCDIHGWVEFRDAALDEERSEKDWYAVIDVGIVLDRSYSMFGSLFGVRNSTDFSPIAAGRGLPPDVSEEVAEAAAWEDNHSHTWVTWDELQAAEWDEARGCWAWADAGGGVQKIQWLSATDPRSRPGITWREDGLLFTAERATRRRAVGDSWQLLMDMTEPLARRYGAACVRVVVWFDN